MLRIFHNAFDFSKLGYKRYAYTHRHYVFHHGCIWNYILIFIRDSSPNDLKRYLQMERICFAVMLIQMALILVSSSLDPEKVKIMRPTWNW